MISFRSLTKRYGSHTAVDSLSLEVARPEVVALLGPNGSGKTTTLKAAAGLIRPTSGEVLLGDPPRPAHVPEVRRVLSYLPQKVSFPDALSGAEVVEFYRELRGVPAERSLEVLRFAALNGAGERLVSTYSGGMVQRLGLAVAILPDAPIFLLDEPTAALDPDGLCAFYELVEHARGDGRTVLFTSHQLGDVERLADRFAVLVGGKLVACLTAGELKDRLAERGVMRLRLGARPEGLLAGPASPRSARHLGRRGARGTRPRRGAAPRDRRGARTRGRGAGAHRGGGPARRALPRARGRGGSRLRPRRGGAMSERAALLLAATLLAGGCASGPPEPATLDTRNEACASCRMAVSDARFASQVVAPGELPRFFDDLGCLAESLRREKAPAGAVAYVADHRTKAWIRADRAVYTRNPGLETPMSSHVIAHADAGSRDQDPDSKGGTPVALAELFGPQGPPTGGAR